jgi:uncharacterized secreted protein with C-terminal beta-propeller domain
MGTATRILAAALVAALTATIGCTAPDEDGSASPPRGSTAALPGDIVLAALTPFGACDDYLAHVQEHALELVTPYGLGGGPWFAETVDEAVAETIDEAVAEADDGVRAPAGDPVAGVDFSGTNVQEVGVDEPDTVKTDGRFLYVVSAGVLHVLDVAASVPRQVATLDLADAWDAQLLLDGDRLLVTTSGHGGVIALDAATDVVLPPRGGWSQTTVVTLVDVSDPSAPRVTERLTVDGRTVSARMVDGVARLVVRSEPVNLPFVYPQGGGLRAEREALEANREVIRRSTADDWIPYFVHEATGRRASEGALVACDRIARPEAFSGLGTVTVLTVDLARGDLRPGPEATAVLAGGDTVYASRERLYVATTRWIDWERLSERDRTRTARDVTTEIHAFDISDPRTAVYVASGQVPGTLLSQWAMSEHDGHLRVASTVGSAWWGSREPSESLVTVLAPRGRELAVVGQVGGLGLTERIYAVRFIGDAGYVVTFREVDPLYTIDLSDPTDPIVEGELKILGYSAYLHPVGEGLLLGVGQDADEQGMLKGTQLSLFDVSDPTRPLRIDQVTIGGGWSDVEHDHRAFLHWPPTGLAVVPFSRWDVGPHDRAEGPSSGVVTFTADAARGIEERAVLTHLDLMAWPGDGLDRDDPTFEELGWDRTWQARIVRSVVVGDRLLTVSAAGVAAHDLDTLDALGWEPLER